jgi:hypothetical protein
VLQGGGVASGAGLLAVLGAGPSEAALSTSTKTGSYTLTAADAGAVIQFDSPTDVTLTVPAAVGAVGMLVEVCQLGVGRVRLVGSGGAVLNSPGSLMSRTQYSTLGLRKRSSSAWIVTGDLT